MIAIKALAETCGGVSIAPRDQPALRQALAPPRLARTVANAPGRMAAADRIVEKGRGGHGGVYSRNKK